MKFWASKEQSDFPFYIISSIILTIFAVINALYHYFWDNFKLPFAAVVYTLSTPLDGADMSMVKQIISVLVVSVLKLFAMLITIWGIRKTLMVVRIALQIRIVSYKGG